MQLSPHRSKRAPLRLAALLALITLLAAFLWLAQASPAFSASGRLSLSAAVVPAAGFPYLELGFLLVSILFAYLWSASRRR